MVLCQVIGGGQISNAMPPEHIVNLKTFAISMDWYALETKWSLKGKVISQTTKSMETAPIPSRTITGIDSEFNDLALPSSGLFSCDAGKLPVSLSVQVSFQEHRRRIEPVRLSA